MSETAAHLVDRVFPEVPVRQCVLSVPFALPYRLAYDKSLVRDVRQSFARARERESIWKIKDSNAGARQFSVATNWFEELKERVPVLGACRELAPSKQESTTYEPSLVCKLLILSCRLLIPDRLLVTCELISRPLPRIIWRDASVCKYQLRFTGIDVAASRYKDCPMTNQQPGACTVSKSTGLLVPLRLALAIALVLLFPLTARGDFFAEAVRAIGPISLDGQLDTEEWMGAAHLGAFVQFEPHRGEAAEVQTEVYILYDDLYVYFRFRCFDPEPSQIAAQLTQRDSDLLTDDAVLVVIDTFADRRSAYYFSTNLLGTQADGRITDNGRVVENTWDAAWRSAAARSDEGWSAEIAIPLAALRFRSGDSVEWGLNLGRTSRRLLETSFWAGPLEERYRISQYGTLSGLSLETAQKRYELIPYMLADFEEAGDSTATAGLDFRYALSPENVFNLTLNPDFAIVEADQEVINLTRFEVNLPEKRQFFLEGSEQYRQHIPTFYSRRIADIRVGSKFLGRSGGWQYSLLTAQSDPIPIRDDIPLPDSANYSVVRLQRDILESSHWRS